MTAARKRLSIWVASKFLPEVEAEFSNSFDIRFEQTANPADALLENGHHFDALVISFDVPMRADAIAALPESIRAIATYSVGTDHIDLGAARNRGIAVFNTPGVLSDSVAENAILMMLGVARRATESIALIREKRWTGWTPTQVVGVELAGRTLGILGLGDIGVRIAKRAQAFGMSILYSNRNRVKEDVSRGFEFRATPEELISDSDVFLIACPSTPETRGLVNKALLSHARAGTIILNIARGDIVEDKALIEALRSGRIWGAGLDVFAAEPKVDPAYFDLPNVFMLPHTGSSTIEARMRMGRILIDALASWQEGDRPDNRVC